MIVSIYLTRLSNSGSQYQERPRQIMKNVLEGFIGTYTSRNSDYCGYWLHGQLPLNVLGYDIDLLGMPRDEHILIGMAQRLAIQRFKEQLTKSGLDVVSIRSAYLKINLQSKPVEGWQGDHRSEGRMVDFVVTVVMDNGRSYERRRKVFVAPHDPQKERRRSPEDWGV